MIFKGSREEKPLLCCLFFDNSLYLLKSQARRAYTAAGTAPWEFHPSEDLSELPVDRSIMIPDESRGGSLPTLFEETGPARYLLWPSLMAAAPPQVVLARSFPSLVPSGTYVCVEYAVFEVLIRSNSSRDHVHLGFCFALAGIDLLRANESRMLCMMDRSLSESVPRRRSRRACCSELRKFIPQ